MLAFFSPPVVITLLLETSYARTRNRALQRRFRECCASPQWFTLSHFSAKRRKRTHVHTNSVYLPMNALSIFFYSSVSQFAVQIVLAQTSQILLHYLCFQLRLGVNESIQVVDLVLRFVNVVDVIDFLHILRKLEILFILKRTIVKLEFIFHAQTA